MTLVQIRERLSVSHLVRALLLVVELRGLEPLTFSLRTRRATDCAIAPRTGGPISTETLPPSGRGGLARFSPPASLAVSRSRHRSVGCHRHLRAGRGRHSRTGKINRTYGPRGQRLRNIGRHSDRDGIPESTRLRRCVGLAT